MEYAFSTPRTLLRGLEREDCAIMADFYNNRELLEGFLFPHEPVFPATKAEVEGLVDYFKQGNWFALCVEHRETHKPIGFAAIKPYMVNRVSFISICLSPEFWGQGYGTEVMNTLLEISFDYFNMRKACLCVCSFNERAIRSYEKVGFEVEGRLREVVYRNGRYFDLVWMGLTKNDHGDTAASA